jgi:hypothetical protein
MNQDTPRGAGRWNTVRYAIDDWGRTIRLCLILTVLSVPPAAAALLAHSLLWRLPSSVRSGLRQTRTALSPDNCVGALGRNEQVAGISRGDDTVHFPDDP